MTNRKYAFIGDIHSQVKPLRAALEHCQLHGLTPIFLGDLFDSQCEVSDAPAVYSLVKDSQQELGSIVIRSNHQFLLESFAAGKTVPLKKDFARTVSEFREAGICIQEVASWLNTMPYVVALRDSKGLEYRIAHAEIPSSITVPEYSDIWMYMEPKQDEIQYLLWGADYKLPDRDRFWWLKKQPRNWVAVAGHYHKVFNKNNTLILDAGCGGKTRSWYDKRSAELLLFEVESREIINFPCF